jgi:hypothetical protein
MKISLFTLVIFITLAAFSSEIEINKIEVSNLITQLESLTFESDPSSTTKREYTLEIAEKYLSVKSDISKQEREIIESHVEKLNRFNIVEDNIANCSSLDKRGLQRATVLGASQVKECNYDKKISSNAMEVMFGPLQDSILSKALYKQTILDGLTSKLAMKRLMPFAVSKSKDEICSSISSNYPEYESEITKLCSSKESALPSFGSIELVNLKLNEKAKRINSVLSKLNRSINHKLKLFKKRYPDSNALDWREEVKRVGERDPLYREYLKVYREETSDELGRLTLIPPLDTKFGLPLEFNFKKIKSPLSGVRGVEIILPIHASDNLHYSSTRPKLDLSKSDAISLTNTITSHQDRTESKLLRLKRKSDGQMKLLELLKINPYSMGQVLMESPMSSKHICSLIEKISNKDRNIDMMFKTIDFVALGLGIIPIAGMGATTFIRGGSMLARAAAVTGRAVSGKMATVLGTGSLVADTVNLAARIAHHNLVLSGIQDSIIKNQTTSIELKQDFDQAREELDRAIVEAKLMGTLGVAKLVAMTSNLIKLHAGLNPKELASSMRAIARNIKINSSKINYKFPTALVLSNSKLSRVQRLAVSESLIPGLTKKQGEAIITAHKYGTKGSVYEFSPIEIRAKYKILIDAGISSDDARILVKGGITGGYKEGTLSERFIARIPGLGPSPKKIGLIDQFKELGKIKTPLTKESFKSINNSLKNFNRNGIYTSLAEEDDIPLEVVKLIEKSITDQRVGSLRGLTDKQKYIVHAAREEFKDKDKTLDKLAKLRRSFIRQDDDGVLYVTGVPEEVYKRSGHTLIYKGTFHGDKMIVSKSQVGKPVNQIPRGDKEYLTYHEGTVHGRVEIGDGISVTTDPTIAASYGTSVITYQIPNKVFKHLPAGDPTLAEKVFKYSIPDEYRVLTVDKQTMQRYNKLIKNK